MDITKELGLSDEQVLKLKEIKDDLAQMNNEDAVTAIYNALDGDMDSVLSLIAYAIEFKFTGENNEQ